MKRNIKNLLKHIVLSAVLLSLLIGLDFGTAQAQWTVFDPAQYALQVEKRLEEATRWVETINHYVQMYDNAVKQYEKMIESVTNLRGILDKVDEQIMRHKDLIQTYATLGRLIRDTFELKKRIETTITSQIHSVVNIARRLKSGIFDMDADKRDLDDFLRFSIGRSADAQMANLERLAKLDSELERMLFDRENILLDLAKLYEERERIADATRAIAATPDPDQNGVEALINQMLAINLRITAVEGQLRELEARIQAKFVTYGLKTEQMTEFGNEIRKTSEMMTGITQASDSFLKELEKYEVWDDDVYQSPVP